LELLRIVLAQLEGVVLLRIVDAHLIILRSLGAPAPTYAQVMDLGHRLFLVLLGCLHELAVLVNSATEEEGEDDDEKEQESDNCSGVGEAGEGHLGGYRVREVDHLATVFVRDASVLRVGGSFELRNHVRASEVESI